MKNELEESMQKSIRHFEHIKTMKEQQSRMQESSPSYKKLGQTDQPEPTTAKLKVKKKRQVGRNEALSSTVKYGKLNATLSAHSNAESIKAFVRQGGS